jgi:hypothetical protein
VNADVEDRLRVALQRRADGTTIGEFGFDDIPFLSDGARRVRGDWRRSVAGAAAVVVVIVGAWGLVVSRDSNQTPLTDISTNDVERPAVFIGGSGVRSAETAESAVFAASVMDSIRALKLDATLVEHATRVDGGDAGQWVYLSTPTGRLFVGSGTAEAISEMSARLEVIPTPDSTSATVLAWPDRGWIRSVAVVDDASVLFASSEAFDSSGMALGFDPLVELALSIHNDE